MRRFIAKQTISIRYLPNLRPLFKTRGIARLMKLHTKAVYSPTLMLEILVGEP